MVSYDFTVKRYRIAKTGLESWVIEAIDEIGHFSAMHSIVEFTETMLQSMVKKFFKIEPDQTKFIFKGKRVLIIQYVIGEPIGEIEEHHYENEDDKLEGAIS